MKPISEDIIKEIRKARKEELLSIGELSKRFNLSKSTISQHIKDINITNLLRIRQSENRRKERKAYSAISSRKAYFKQLEEAGKIKPISDNLKSFTKGSMAEEYVAYRLLREGFQVFKPVVITEACDLLVYNGSRYLRIEVKATTGNSVKFAHSLYKDSEQLHSVSYTDKDKIDVFICVNLLFESLFIFPFKEVKGKALALSLADSSFSKDYLNNFNILRTP